MLEIPQLFPFAEIAMAHDRSKRCNGVGGSCCFLDGTGNVLDCLSKIAVSDLRTLGGLSQFLR
jgi:hypothetical protein